MLLRGRVVKGLGIGSRLGYPTANLDCGDAQCPAPGVYAGRAIVNGKTHNGAVVIGARTEYGRPLVEILLLDFQGDLYGKELEVEVLKKVSDTERLGNENALVRKIEEDIKQVRLCLREL